MDIKFVFANQDIIRTQTEIVSPVTVVATPIALTVRTSFPPLSVSDVSHLSIECSNFLNKNVSAKMVSLSLTVFVLLAPVDVQSVPAQLLALLVLFLLLLEPVELVTVETVTTSCPSPLDIANNAH